MNREFAFALWGYFSGSILFAKLSMGMAKKYENLDESTDRNPGTANAFLYGGFLCGIVTLLGDLLKGLLPVAVYIARCGDVSVLSPLFPLVLAAPVIGHVYPVFHHFQGGKGIATTFGVLLGLLPQIVPVVIVAVTFILFSVVVRINPHLHRTSIVYLVSLIAMAMLDISEGVVIGFLLIALTVWVRLWRSKEHKEGLQVKMLWMH